jgi:hypothetical protein
VLVHSCGIINSYYDPEWVWPSILKSFGFSDQFLEDSFGFPAADLLGSQSNAIGICEEFVRRGVLPNFREGRREKEL